jgi:hypothetical protein
MIHTPVISSRRMRWAGHVEWEGMDLIDLAQELDKCRALVNAVLNLRVASNARNLTSWVPVSFSGRTLLHGVSSLVNVLHSAEISVFQTITERSRSTVHCCVSNFLSDDRTICTLILHCKTALFSPLKILDSKINLSSPSRIEVKHEENSTL